MAIFNTLMVKSNTSLAIVNSPLISVHPPGSVRPTGIVGDYTVNLPLIHPLASVGPEHFSLLVNLGSQLGK